MSSKKEEERNEKIIRGLLKLPPNRKCINCNSLGPQYVCTNFWTFVCTACSGIHREFTHRVKSVSMAKFTKQEVEALQSGGNQRARELFLKDWDTQQMRLPDSRNPDKIREFIKNVYVDKKYASGKSSDKPPRDPQSVRNNEEHRRASSYHSYSQSPPYEHQYEERRYGKQSGMLTRRPGSDRGLYEGKTSSFMYSPGRLGEHMYEDRFANESGSRMSDFSVASDPYRYDVQSPNAQEIGYNSPPSRPVREFLVQDARAHPEANVKENADAIPRSHRTISSGSFGSFDSNSISLKSVNSGSFGDIVLEPEHSSGNQQAYLSTHPTVQSSSVSSNVMNIDLFSQPSVEPPTNTASPPVDLFAEISRQPSSSVFSQDKTLSIQQNVGLFADASHQPSTATLSQDKSVSVPKSIDLFAEVNHQQTTATLAQNMPAIAMQTMDMFAGFTHQHSTSCLSMDKSVTVPHAIDLFADGSHQPSTDANTEKKTALPPENRGWAIFDVPDKVGHTLVGNDVLPDKLPPKDGVPKETVNLFSSTNSTDWYSVQRPPDRGQWHAVVNDVRPPSTSPQVSELWNVFHDISSGVSPPSLFPSQTDINAPSPKPAPSSPSLFGPLPSQTDIHAPSPKPAPSGDNLCPILSTGDVTDRLQKSAVPGSLAGINLPFGNVPGLSPPILPEASSPDRKSSNPFDLPFDSEIEANSPFMDMSSLQVALPNSQLPNTFLDGFSEPWYAQNSVNTYVPSIPTGLSFMTGQSTQLLNAPSQGPAASLGGNPFA